MLFRSVRVALAGDEEACLLTVSDNGIGLSLIHIYMDGILKLLWTSGNALESGGAVSASLAIMLVLLVKKVLAMVLLDVYKRQDRCCRSDPGREWQ